MYILKPRTYILAIQHQASSGGLQTWRFSYTYTEMHTQKHIYKRALIHKPQTYIQSSHHIRPHAADLRRRLIRPVHTKTHIYKHTHIHKPQTYSLAITSGLIQQLSDVESFVLCTAALCHDLEHPGVNNAFLLQSSSPLTACYGNKSTLEKHHAYVACKMILDTDLDLLSELDEEQRTEFCDTINLLILATDMARHAEYVAKLNAYSAPIGLAREHNPAGIKVEDKKLAMQILMKCADTSNVIKPFDIAKKWAMLISEEFFLQGDLERVYGIDLTPMYDREKQRRVSLQKGFIDVVVRPFYHSVERVFPQLTDAFRQLDVNRKMWNEYDDERLERDCGNKYYVQLPAYAS